MILNENSEYAVVLDACVIVPMTLCDTLLRLAEHPALYRPLWSEEILQEVDRALEKKLYLTRAQVDRRLKAMQEAFPEALVKIPSKLLETFECPDSGDRHVLAAAVRGQANAIITNNTKDFPKDCLEEYGVLCQTPDDFLVHQFHLNPSLIFEKLDQQGAAIRQTRDYIVKKMQSLAPQFTALLAAYLVN